MQRPSLPVPARGGREQAVVTVSIMMEHRLGRTLRVFLVVLAAAGFYRLAVVPFVEPRIRETVTAHEMTPEEAAAIRARADRRLAALGDVFPAGSWERDNPIMLESRQMRLLFKEYHSLPDGRVNLVPCTLVVLPDRNRVAAEKAGGRTIVLRAPQGAVLEFDEPLDLRQGRLAKLVGGSLRGQVTIRGTPSAPNADDDIEIVTRDIELDELEVQTNEMVQFRYGRSSGSGRGMMAKLMPREGAPRQAAAAKPGKPGGPVSDQGPNIGGVDSIRLDRDVRMRLEGLAGSFLPGREAEPAASATTAAADQPPAPVLVSCRGSLCLNVSANVITLEDHVDVIRTSAESTTDHLACDLLAIMLARREATPGGAEGRKGGLEPVEIQAKGSPVVVTSDGAELEARAARLGYEIATRRILLDGDEPVALTVRDTEMEARRIDYCPGPPGDPGSLLAVGPGWLRGRAAEAPPMQVRWQQWLRMRPDGEGHVVSIAGDSEVVVERQGRLAATEMHLWLDMAATAGPKPKRAGPPGPDFSRVRPSRLLARGIVEADADAATVRTDRLELWFRSEQPAPQVAQAAPPQQPAAAAPAQATPAPAQPRQPREEQPRGKLVASGGLVRGLVVLAPAGNQIEELSMEGQVRLVEQPLAAAAPPEPPLEIHGDQVQVSRPQRFDARAIVSGRPARVNGRGLELEGPLVEFDRGRSRLTVDGAGRLALPAGQAGASLDVFGFGDEAAPPAQAAPPVAGPAAAAQKLNIVWQGRMDFDGLTARFVEKVVAASDRATVHAGSLDVVFDRPFTLGADGAERGGPQPDVARIACGSGVRVESESQAADGGRSKEQLFVKDLVIDRATGDVAGTGPGRLTSTRLGQSPALNLAPGGAAGTPPRGGVQPVAATTAAAGLSYLGVDFQRGLRGNLNRRMMEFHQRVEAIWGPVAGWGDTLDPHAAAGLPAGVFTVSCDVLGLGQSPQLPASKRPGIELAAGGNVLVEGEAFTARSARLTWSEAKDLLVFEGDGRSDAQLFRQLQAGGQPSSASAGKILYWRGLNRVDVEDARYLDLDQLRGGGPAPGLPGAAAPVPRRPAPQQPQRPLPST
ncbi:MAG: hypothetical protein RLZZ21_1573 [Planctomycetota bacterium]|jgi:hypothetical protein